MNETEDTQVAPTASSATDDTHPFDGLLASIRAAVAADASPEARANGAIACRSLLTALEARPGEPLTARSPKALPEASASPIASLLAQLRSMPRDKMFELLKQLATSPKSPLEGILARLAGMPREQLVELVNKQLRVLAPAGTPLQLPTGPRFHLIPIPQPRRPGGGA